MCHRAKENEWRKRYIWSHLQKTTFPQIVYNEKIITLKKIVLRVATITFYEQWHRNWLKPMVWTSININTSKKDRLFICGRLLSVFFNRSVGLLPLNTSKPAPLSFKSWLWYGIYYLSLCVMRKGTCWHFY